MLNKLVILLVEGYFFALTKIVAAMSLTVICKYGDRRAFLFI